MQCQESRVSDSESVSVMETGDRTQSRDIPKFPNKSRHAMQRWKEGRVASTVAGERGPEAGSSRKDLGATEYTSYVEVKLRRNDRPPK
ncbi:UNVERIFIED_CONTAM: hypothetical protein FKN15_057720 [Acipenser sinensis]